MVEIITVTLNDNSKRDLLVQNGYAYVLTGHDENAAAEVVEVARLTDVQKKAAIAVNDFDQTPLGVELYEEASNIISKKNAFEDLLQKMAFEMDPAEVFDEIRYAKEHQNTFSRNFDPFNVSVNADDLYCSAIARLTRKQFGEYSEMVLLTAANECKDTFVALMNQYRTLLASIIVSDKKCFDTWSEKEIRDYRTKSND